MEIPKLIKDHPFIAAGAVVVVVLLMRSGGGGTAASAVNATIQSQKIASDTNIALANYQTTASIARSANAADMYKTKVTTEAALAVNNSQAMIAALLGGFSHDENLKTISANSAAVESANKSALSVSLSQIAADLQAVFSTNAAKTSIVKDTLASSDSQLAATIKSSDFQFMESLKATIANLPLINKHSENLATISGNTATSMATIGANANTAMANINSTLAQAIAQITASTSKQNTVVQAATAPQSDGGNFIGDVIGGITSLIGGFF